MKKNIYATLNFGAATNSSVGSVFSGLQKRVDSLGASMGKLRKQSSEIAKLQKAQAAAANAKASGNLDEYARQNASIKRLSASLRQAGVDTGNLTSEQARLAGAIADVDKQLTRARGWNAAFTGLRGQAGHVGSALDSVKSKMGSLAAKTAVAGAGIGYLFKTQFLDVASTFEDFQTTLKTLEGGNVAKAKASFGWISDFAATTPYELAEVTEAFVKLRAYGIDPIKGDTLRALGDTASSMGKSIMDSVEAISDAMTGENERLKEFGIKAAKKGGQIIYSYTNQAGKQMTKTVDASNREMIRSSLVSIWNEKFHGAMSERSKGWKGMVSNMNDQWARFTSRVMAGGAFDWMKSKLGSILAEIDKAAADGRMKQWADKTGDALKYILTTTWKVGGELVKAASATSEFVGGWKNLGIIVGGFALAPTVLSVGNLAVQLVKLVPSLYSVGAAATAMLVPWGLLAAAIGAAAIAIHQNWGGIGDWFRKNVWMTMNEDLEKLGESLRALGEGFEFVYQKAKKFFEGQAVKFGTLKQEAPVFPVELKKAQMQSPFFAPKTTTEKSAEKKEVKQNFNQDVKIFITTPPGQDAAKTGDTIKSKLKEMKLYDAAATLFSTP